MLCPTCPRFLVFTPLSSPQLLPYANEMTAVEPVPVVCHVSEHYHFPVTDERGMRRSHTYGGNLSIHITTTCSQCGHSFPRDHHSQESCRACRREQRRARARQEILAEELAALRARQKKQADAIAGLRAGENLKEMEAKAKANAMRQKLEQDAARHASEQDALCTLAQEAACQQEELEAIQKRAKEAARQHNEKEALLKLIEEAQKKLAQEEATRKLTVAEAARKYAEEVVANQRAEKTKKQEAERLAAQERERQYIYNQYIASQQAELDRLKSHAAVKAAAGENRKRVQEELDRVQRDEESRKKVEEEAARQAAFALAKQYRLQEQARLNKERRERIEKGHQKREEERLAAETAYADFVLAQSQELSCIEADKKLRDYYEQIEEDKERALIREEVKKELANRGPEILDNEELLRRLNALKTDGQPPVPPPHKTTHKVNLEWESGYKGRYN
jgi:hypothetical protein